MAKKGWYTLKRDTWKTIKFSLLFTGLTSMIIGLIVGVPLLLNHIQFVNNSQNLAITYQTRILKGQVDEAIGLVCSRDQSVALRTVTADETFQVDIQKAHTVDGPNITVISGPDDQGNSVYRIRLHVRYTFNGDFVPPVRYDRTEDVNVNVKLTDGNNDFCVVPPPPSP